MAAVAPHLLPPHGAPRTVAGTWATVIPAVAALHLVAALWAMRTEALTAPTPLPPNPALSVSWVSPVAPNAVAAPDHPAPTPKARATALPPQAPAPRVPAASVAAVQAIAPAQPAPQVAPVVAQAAQTPQTPQSTPVAQVAQPSATPSSLGTDTRRAEPESSPRPQPASSTPPSYDAAYLHNPQPSYPAVSRREGEQGRVLLRVRVLASGQADQVEVQRSSGFDRLDKAARTAVARWTFTPARAGDRPVAEWVTVPIDFSLQ